MIRAGCALLAAILLSGGCARIPPTALAPSAVDALWAARQEQLNNLRQWNLRGRVAIRTSESGASAHLRWERKDQQSRIDLFGAFGGGKARLWVDENGARLRDHQGQEFEADSATQVLADGTGWHIPLDELGYWIRGLPAPSEVRAIETDARGALISLSQLGWDITYSEYAVFDQKKLPRKIRMMAWPDTVKKFSTHAGLIGDTLIVKILIEHWSERATVKEMEQ